MIRSNDLFEIEGLDDVVKEMEKIIKKYPLSVKDAIGNEQKVALAYIKSEVDRRTKGHGSKPGTLKRRFAIGPVKDFLGKATGVITTSAPHYYLVEDGHDPGGWHAEQENPDLVEGKKIVAKVMAVRSEHAAEMAQKVLDEVLDDLF